MQICLALCLHDESLYCFLSSGQKSEVVRVRRNLFDDEGGMPIPVRGGHKLERRQSVAVMETTKSKEGVNFATPKKTKPERPKMATTPKGGETQHYFTKLYKEIPSVNLVLLWKFFYVTSISSHLYFSYILICI